MTTAIKTILVTALLLAAFASAWAGDAATSQPATAGAVNSATPTATAPTTAPAAVTARQAMDELAAGNARFVAGKSVHPRADAARRTETAVDGQHPFATILACSDSRSGPEVIFDQGIGDVFVVRVAGNVSGTDEVGSIEYGTGHLHTPLLVVLGHSKCGAVRAACSGGHVGGSISALVDKIEPAVKKAKEVHPGLKGADLVEAAIVANVWQAIADTFAKSAEVRELVSHGKLKVVGALHDLESGKVTWLGEHPGQKQLLAAEKPAAAKRDAKQSPADSHAAAQQHVE